MRKLVLLLVGVLILPFGLAQEELNPDIGFGVANAEDLGITNPKLVSRIDLEFIESGTFTVDPSGNSLKELNLELFSYPRPDYYSEISNLGTSPSAVVEDGFYSFGWEDVPAGETDYELTADIVLDFALQEQRLYQPFPFSNIPDDVRVYLEPTEKINSDDPAIKMQANEIILGEDDAFVVAYKLAKFVSDEMTYDINYLGRVESSSRVLADKTGVCVEYSNLFIALARSVGIPARYVSGYAYGNVYGEQFNAHAWTEVYLPHTGWIPFDPTFGEFGWLDMTHIKTQVSEGPEQPSLRYTWIGGDVVTSEPDVRVNLNSKQEALPTYIENTLSVEKETIAPGSYNIVWMDVENTRDFYIAPESFLTASPKIVGKNQQSILLGPEESSRVGWIIQIPEDLDSGFTYTYTVNAQTLFGTEETTQFFVDPRSEESISLDQAEFILGVDVVEETVSGLAPMLSVNIQSPEVAYTEEEYNILVELYNSGTAPIEKLTVCVENAGKSCETVFMGINDRQTLTFTELPDMAGTEHIFVTISGQGIEESQVVDVTVENRSPLQKIEKFLQSLIDSILSQFRK